MVQKSTKTTPKSLNRESFLEFKYIYITFAYKKICAELSNCGGKQTVPEDYNHDIPFHVLWFFTTRLCMYKFHWFTQWKEELRFDNWWLCVIIFFCKSCPAQSLIIYHLRAWKWKVMCACRATADRVQLRYGMDGSSCGFSFVQEYNLLRLRFTIWWNTHHLDRHQLFTLVCLPETAVVATMTRAPLLILLLALFGMESHLSGSYWSSLYSLVFLKPLFEGDKSFS